MSGRKPAADDEQPVRPAQPAEQRPNAPQQPTDRPHAEQLPAPTPDEQPQEQDESTVPGGVYGDADGQGYHDAEGNPVTKDGKPIKQDQG